MLLTCSKVSSRCIGKDVGTIVSLSRQLGVDESMFHFLTGLHLANVAGLVYVAAFVPDAGESVSTLIEGGAPPPVQPSNDGFLFFDPTIFPRAFAQDISPAQGAFLAATQVPPAAAAFDAKVSQPAWKGRRSWYVLATEDRIIPPAAQRRMAMRAKASITEVAGSHAVYISQPKAVADAIDAAARAAEQ